MLVKYLCSFSFFFSSELILEDVCSLIDTPNESTDEDSAEDDENIFEHQPLPEQLHFPHDDLPQIAEMAHYNISAQEMTELMLKAKWQPSDGTPYKGLVNDNRYKKKIRKKIRSAKRMVSIEAVDKAIKHNAFWRRLNYVYSECPQSGGRHYLYLLLGLIC
jgi:hypothetical protein